MNFQASIPPKKTLFILCILFYARFAFAQAPLEPASIPASQTSASSVGAPTSQAASLPESNPASSVAAPKKDTVTCPTNEAISVLPLAFRRAGVSVQYERQLNDKPYSLAGALGLRFGAREPFLSTQYALGLEIKRWPSLLYWKQKGSVYGVGRLDMGGAFLRGEQSKIGKSFLVESNIGVGYRWVRRQKIEISSALTIAMRADIDRSGLLPAIFTGSAGFWLSVGYLF